MALAAAPLAIAAPIPTSIIALAVFGIGHTVLELRWVLARFRPLFTPGFTAALAVPATAIALARLTGLPRHVEIAAGFGLVALGLAHARRTGRLSNTSVLVAGVVLAASLAATLRQPAAYGIVLAHLHNVVTGVLLWHWAPGAATPDGAKRFRAGLVACFAVVPALILSGALDALLPDRLATTGATAILTGAVTPPDWAATTAGIRVVAVFAFLQLVHYGVWCWLLPRRSPAPGATRATRTTRATPAVLVFTTAVLALVFATDYAAGRTLYTSIATYHAYLELPVVLVLLGGARVPR